MIAHCPKADTAALQLPEVAGDLGADPVLGADKLAPDDALPVEDESFRRARGAEGEIGALGAVEQCAHSDVVVDHVLAVGLRILVKADRQHNNAGHLLLQLGERWPLSQAVGAPGRPEVEHDDLAAKLVEREGMGAIGNGNRGRGLADLAWMRAPVAACGGEAQAEQQRKQAWDAHLPIIRGSDRRERRAGNV